LAREFPRSAISPRPFPNVIEAPSQEFKRLQAGNFVDWRVTVDGLVDRPGAFSLDQLRSYPLHSQITELGCEEGWSYIAEWNGVRLSHVLNMVGVHPQARYVVYFSTEPDTWESIDMADAMHPQTFLTYGMNGDDLPVAHGGPLRLRVPRQLGYKNVKFVTHLTVTDSMKRFGKGLGGVNPEFGYRLVRRGLTSFFVVILACGRWPTRARFLGCSDAANPRSSPHRKFLTSIKLDSENSFWT
jgi:DMSO/TMAO reductase YedYZ molybdopterin-dependent catalytic subunit